MAIILKAKTKKHKTKLKNKFLFVKTNECDSDDDDVPIRNNNNKRSFGTMCVKWCVLLRVRNGRATKQRNTIILFYIYI